MKILQIDSKWSIEYDPENNDRPIRILRYGEPHAPNATTLQNNFVVAMFYALLSKEPIVENMTQRFLQWELPENFNHDAGISFEKLPDCTPIGTNLFDYTQAKDMVKHMVEGDI